MPLNVAGSFGSSLGHGEPAQHRKSHVPDFSSAFNTIQPLRMCHLQKFSDDSSISSCITVDNGVEYRVLVGWW
ncbi:unnamed protein product [Lota lota]